MSAPTLFICRGCAGHDMLRAEMVKVGLAPAHADCLGQCPRPGAVALRGPGRAAYVFHGVTAEDAPALAAFARAWQAAPAGEIADARPFGDLRFKLAARIPALPAPSA